ncbi:MAG: pyridoxamine 5'-phosphate oxidase [Cyclobacteriaceae bacterium]
MNLADIRNEYTQKELNIRTVDQSPFEQFQKWFNESIESKILEPNGMILSTVSSEGFPSQRTVLLKAFDEKGFVFYTNYNSKKAQHIEQSPKVSIIFPWYDLERQVIITGVAEKVSTAESIKYFTSRPRGSQLGAWVSHQSSIISSRSILETKLAEMKAKFKEGKIPLPDFWGGYRIAPISFEFWQGRKNRLHDRIFYQRENDNWTIGRLAP